VEALLFSKPEVVMTKEDMMKKYGKDPDYFRVYHELGDLMGFGKLGTDKVVLFSGEIILLPYIITNE